MPAVARNRSVPNIVVSDADCDRLTDLATASLERVPDVAEELLSEMERAQVVSEDEVPADVVRMGSTVTFRSDAGTDGEQHELTETLVYPGRRGADRPRGRPVDFVDGPRRPQAQAHGGEGFLNLTA